MSEDTKPLPAGEYAIVEVLGHRTLVGRVEEIERFGTKLMQIEPLYRGELLDPVLIGGSSIYQFTACTADTAAARAPKHDWQLPASVRAVLPAALLTAPAEDPEFAEVLARCGHEEGSGECAECMPF